MFCEKCGKSLPIDARFCKYCGKERTVSEEHEKNLQQMERLAALKLQYAAQNNITQEPLPQKRYYRTSFFSSNIFTKLLGILFKIICFPIMIFFFIFGYLTSVFSGIISIGLGLLTTLIALMAILMLPSASYNATFYHYFMFGLILLILGGLELIVIKASELLLDWADGLKDFIFSPL